MILMKSEGKKENCWEYPNFLQHISFFPSIYSEVEIKFLPFIYSLAFEQLYDDIVEH